MAQGGCMPGKVCRSAETVATVELQRPGTPAMVAAECTRSRASKSLGPLLRKREASERRELGRYPVGIRTSRSCSSRCSGCPVCASCEHGKAQLPAAMHAGRLPTNSTCTHLYARGRYLTRTRTASRDRACSSSASKGATECGLLVGSQERESRRTGLAGSHAGVQLAAQLEQQRRPLQAASQG